MRTHISSKDCRCLLTLINQLYTLSDRETVIQAVVKGLRSLVPFSSAAYIAMESSGLFRPDGHILVDSPQKALSAFTDYYAAIHPFTLSGWVHHINEAARITDFVPGYRLPDTEYGRDFLPMTPCTHELGVIMGSQGDHVGALCLHRQKLDRNFSDRELQIVNYLAPHMARVINHLQLLNRLNAGQFSSETGVVRVRPDGEVAMNEEARKIFHDSPDPSLPNPPMTPSAVIFKTSGRRYRFRTTTSHPETEHILIFEPLPYAETLFQRLSRWDFTDRQREIVLKVIRGESNREIAMALSVTEQTVKEHLRNIFDKVEVHRRSELISRILSNPDN